MAETLSFAVTASAWVEIADGSENVTVQRRGAAAVLVHVGTTAPALTAAGITLGPIDSAFSLGSLEAADKVYARARDTDSAVIVVRN